MKFFKRFNKTEDNMGNHSRETAKERLHLVLMQDRANVSADFLELMKQEIIEVIKKYIDVDEGAIDVRLTNKENENGINGAPALYANIPILNIKNEARKVDTKEEKNKETKKKKTEKVENKEEVKNERIAQAIIDGEIYQDEKSNKKSKKEKKAEVVSNQKDAEKKHKEVLKQEDSNKQEKQTSEKEEIMNDTEEELKSED